MTDVVHPNEPTTVTEPKDELVSKKVLEDFKADFFKQKEKARQLEEELQRHRDEKAILEKKALEEKQEWKVLYEKEKAEREKAVSELKSKADLFINTSKINAVVQLLGGFKKESYAKFINTSNIETNEDGTFTAESIRKEADRIKQEYPELIVGVQAPKIPGTAPRTIDQNINQTKSLHDLSIEELRALIR